MDEKKLLTAIDKLFAPRFNKIDSRFDKIDSRLDKLEKGQANLEEGQAKLVQNVMNLEKGQANLEEGQAKLVQNVMNLEKGQAKLVQNVMNLEKGQAKLSQSVTNLEKDTKAIKTKLDATFERTGRNFEEIKKLEKKLDDLKIIKTDIKSLKYTLKDKADLEEFLGLEERVSIIEKRILTLAHR